jgi:hypothetical protein
LKWIQKNTLRATMDLAVQKWMLMLRGCLWHVKNGKQWVSSPRVDRQLAKKNANLVEFTNKETTYRFQVAALAAVHVLSGDGEPE